MWAEMMVNVDALCRRYGGLLAQHILTVSILSHCDKNCRLEAHIQNLSNVPNAKNIAAKVNSSPIGIPVLAISTINNPSTSCKHSKEGTYI